MSMQNIKAVLFDLDGTLYQHIPNSGDVFVDYARSLGYKISDEDKIRAEHWTHFYFANSLAIRDDQKAHLDEKNFWVNFSKRRLVAMGIPASEALELAPKVSAYMADFHKPISFVPEEAFPLLKSLKSAGYILGMVSNREKPYGEKLKELRLDSYFKFALAGVDVNSFKPDRAIFERALEMSGTSAPETMYIGDNYFADIVGSRRAGLVPVLYDPFSLFPDADCTVIKSFVELPELLK